MVQSGHEPIQPVEFESRLHPSLPVEVLEGHELFKRVSPAALDVPQRPTFHALILCHTDQGSHTVDFEEIPAEPGRLVQIRPGQVQVWNTTEELRCTIVLSQPALFPSQPWFPGHRSFCDLDDRARSAAERMISVLADEQRHFDGDEPTSRLMVSLFTALIALFDRTSQSSGEPRLPEVYLAFREAIERDLGASHDVVDYARVLGYSPRTISRACQQVTGLTAKRVLTDRLALEAKRLLVHSDSPAATIALRLGFSEATNFTKFFTRNSGYSPSAYRTRHRHAQRV